MANSNTDFIAPQPADPKDEGIASMMSTLLGAEAMSTAGPLLQPSVNERFQLLKLHAQGGLGEVLLAEDRELHRKVAYKRIKSAFQDRPDAQRRFVMEAEVTAHLEHPGVVPVYGLVSEPDGRLGYAMRYIQGESLADVIQRFHAHTVDYRSLAFRHLLTAFITVCNTLAYSHSRGIVHRDIKPANIMLGKYGETLVVDWGLAKPVTRREVERLTGEATLHTSSDSQGSATEMGTAIGTPQFMSPEQAAGRLDVVGPASDIYSLGATLYVLLTGKVPFIAEDVFELKQKVQSGDWIPLQNVKPKLPRALEAICGKAMSLQPEHRYTSATMLASDLESWLADEPVSVMTDPWPTRCVRWGRRHAAVVTAAFTLLLTSLIAVTVGLGLVNAEKNNTQLALDEVNVERQKTQAAYELVQKALAKATQAQTQTRQALDTLTDTVVGKLLAKNHRLGVEEKQYLQQVLQFYDQLSDQTGNHAQDLQHKANAYARVAIIHSRLGDSANAEKAFRQAVALHQQWTNQFAGSSLALLQLWKAQLDLAKFLHETRRTSQAEVLFQSVIQQLRIHQGQQPTAELQVVLADSLHSFGVVYRDTNRLPQAVKRYREALLIREQLVEQFPEQQEYQHQLSATCNNLGTTLSDLEQAEEAQKLLQRAMTIDRRLLQQNPFKAEYRNSLAYTLNNWGYMLQNNNQYTESLQAWQEALPLYKQLAHDYPTVVEYRYNLASSYNNLGVVFLSLKQVEQAKTHSLQALAIQEQLVEEYPEKSFYAVDLGGSYCNLGNLYAQTDDPSNAMVMYNKALHVLKKCDQDPKAPPEVRTFIANTYQGMASTFHQRKQHREAAQSWDQAVNYLADGQAKDLLTVFGINDWFEAGVAEGQLERLAQLAGKKSHSNGMLFQLANSYALAARLLSVPATKKQELADQAILLLRQAFHKPINPVDQWWCEPQWQALQARADFRALLWDIADVHP